jgi:hypothetical protein
MSVAVSVMGGGQRPVDGIVRPADWASNVMPRVSTLPDLQTLQLQGRMF